jgi:hypothetical protein
MRISILKPCREMMAAKTTTVETRFMTFGKLASWSARRRSLHINTKWKSATITPSNSAPRPTLTVVGEHAFQTMVSQMLVARKRLVTEPRPYPFWRSSTLVEEDYKEGSDNELDVEEADAGAEVFGLAIETGEDVDDGLAEGDDECED